MRNVEAPVALSRAQMPVARHTCDPRCTGRSLYEEGFDDAGRDVDKLAVVVNPDYV